MIKIYRIQLQPTKDQEEKLWQHVHAAREVWNWGLRYQMDRFESDQKRLSARSLKKVLTQLKKTEEYAWLNEVSSQTLSTVILDLGKAYDWFFKLKPARYSKKKKARHKRLGKPLRYYDLERHPKFKRKHETEPRFPVRTDEVYLVNNHVNIEKIGKILYKTEMKLPLGRIQHANGKNAIPQFTNVRIKYVGKKWILCFGIECESQAPTLTNKSLGIDLGIKDLAVASFDGEKIVFNNINKSKRMRTLEEKKKHLQRKRSRQYHVNNKRDGGQWKKTKNILKTEKILKRVQSKLTNKRRDYVHQTTRVLVNLLPKQVIMEDLDVTKMMKNKLYAKAISEQKWYEFRRQMQYKCEFFNIDFILADRFYPSSKICSQCQSVKHNLTIGDRIYKCTFCGLTIDRDFNAALNLQRYADQPSRPAA